MEFDPYAQWLKIPADRRPPTYYDLLGLPACEPDANRIRRNALERSQQVRRYQLGQHSQAAIRLLGELSLAFDTLTTPERKQQYDRTLAGMVTEDRSVGLETVVAEPVIDEARHVSSQSPILAPDVVVATLVDEPAPPPLPVPGSPFQAGYVAPVGKRKRRLLATLAWRTPKALFFAAISSIVLSVRISYWSLRLADRAMRKSLGDENAILHNFARFVFVIAVIGSVTVVCWTGPDLWRRFVPSPDKSAVANSEVMPEKAVIGSVPTAHADELGPAVNDTTLVVSDRLEPPLQANITGPSATVATAPSTDARLNNSLQMALVYVPAGRFVMGSPASEQGRVGTEHAHEVVISQGFYLGVHEVTQSEFQQVMGANPSQPSAGRRGADAANPDTARLPIESVLWSEAVEFCRRLSERTEERAAGRSYRLPTEAQWEYACRAGSNAAYSIGDRLTSADANFKAAGLTSATLRTMQVGSFPPNRWGLHDMHGNVEEWCLDYYDYGYYRNSPMSDPSGPAAGLNRVSRGGSYLDSAEECRSARRMGRYPGSRAVNCGFRVVCEVK